MSKLSKLAALLVALALGACDGSDSFTSGAGPGGPLGPGPAPAAVSVLTSSPSLPSDAGQTVTISAIVRDANNVAMEGVTVILSADSGTLTVTDSVTDQSGIITATLGNGGDPTNRTITLTADAQGVLGSVTVDVIGTTLTLSGPSALPQGDSATYTVVLSDAAGNGIGGQTVDITSSSGNTLSAASLTTDVGGQAQFDLTASAAGTDTIDATALGLTAQQDLNVSNDSFVITAPAAATEVVLNTPVQVDLTWTVGGAPQAGQTISFSSTRGTLSALTAVTDAAGVASVSLQSTNAGPAVITASNAAGTSTQVEIEFIADTPATIEVQANPFTLGPGEQSTITAIVRDAADNLVKNEVVNFVLTDVTNGQLSVASAITDSQGRAQTFYTASSTTSANNGVIIDATVQSNPAITDSVALTVAQRELFISIGTGNTVFEPNSAQYRKEFVVQITDSQGNGVAGVTVQAGILSDEYFKGFYFPDAVAGLWVRNVTVGCSDEDVNRNGQLDAGEDFNSSGRIEAGNIATAVAQNGNGGTFVSDDAGFGLVDVFYPQDHAGWVLVTLEATTSVQGTEFAEASTFVLPGAADDFNDLDVAPPSINSPFGTSNSCADTL